MTHLRIFKFVTNETIFESFWKYLSNMPGKHEIKELQKAAILGTALVTSGIANVMCKTFNVGNNVACTIKSCNTMYPKNVVYFRYIIESALCTGDK